MAETAPDRLPIHNRMRDCGNDRHVGWWTSSGHSHLLVQITPETMLISCCEGDNAKTRINFVATREQAAEIINAASKALGLRERLLAELLEDAKSLPGKTHEELLRHDGIIGFLEDALHEERLR